MSIKIKVQNAPREMVYDGKVDLSHQKWRYNHYTGEVLATIGGKLVDVCQFLNVRSIDCMLDLVMLEPIVAWKRGGPRTSGRTGVFYDSRARKWRASGGRLDPRPYFDTEGEAGEFRDQYEQALARTFVKSDI